MRFFSAVDENVGRNPIAQAMAKASLRTAARDFRIQCYLYPEGEPATAYDTAGSLFAVALKLVEGGAYADRVGALKGAKSCCDQRLSQGSRWHTQDAAALDVGMQVAEEIIGQSKPKEVQQAWLATRTVEA
jgi:hypothetical protein